MAKDDWATEFDVQSGAHSVVGKVRDHNEDSSLVAADLGLFAVADGLGGHLAGEHASNLAVETLAFMVREAKEREDAPSLDLLMRAFSQANDNILDDAVERPERRGMGTTLTAGLVYGTHLLLAHVGDSRAWRLRDGEVQLLTRDHTVVAQQVRDGILTDADAENHPMRHVLSRCLGVQAELEVDLLELDLSADDVFVLASDGLEPGVNARDLVEVLSENEDPEIAAKILVSRACERDGQDNITAVVFACREA